MLFLYIDNDDHEILYHDVSSIMIIVASLVRMYIHTHDTYSKLVFLLCTYVFTVCSYVCMLVVTCVSDEQLRMYILSIHTYIILCAYRIAQFIDGGKY